MCSRNRRERERRRIRASPGACRRFDAKRRGITLPKGLRRAMVGGCCCLLLGEIFFYLSVCVCIVWPSCLSSIGDLLSLFWNYCIYTVRWIFESYCAVSIFGADCAADKCLSLTPYIPRVYNMDATSFFFYRDNAGAREDRFRVYAITCTFDELVFLILRKCDWWLLFCQCREW